MGSEQSMRAGQPGAAAWRPMMVLVSAVVGMAGLWANASTAEITQEYRVGATHSDNLGRTPDSELSDTAATVGVALSTEYASRRVEFDLDSDLEYLHYSEDNFDDEVMGALAAELSIKLIPDTIVWDTTNDFGKLQTDPLRADAPDNRENFNSFATGPGVSLQLGARTSLDLGGQYETNYFELRETDNEIVGSTVTLARRLTSNRSVSLNGSWQDVDYDNDELNSDFERRSVYLGFRSQIPQGLLDVSVGVNEVELDDAEFDGTLASLSFTRQISRKLAVSLGYDRRISETGDIFRRFQSTSRELGRTGDVGGLGGPFRSERLSASVDYEDNENRYFLEVFANEEDYEEANDLERRQRGASVGGNQTVGRDWELSIVGAYLRSEYQSSDRDDDDWSLEARVSRRLTRTVFVDFRYLHADRQSNQPGLEYRENRYALEIRFNPG